MEFKNVLQQRRSIRKFKTTLLTDGVVNELLEFGRLAPSTKNKQPWRCVVVRDKSKLTQIATIMENAEKVMSDTYSKRQITLRSSVNRSANIMKESPCIIFVYKEKDDWMNVSDLLSIGAFIENICLGAAELGLGSLWVRDICYAQHLIGTELQLDDTVELVSAICVGYPDEKPNARPRKSISEFTTYIESDNCKETS